MPVCWNWQTRRTQNPLVVTPYGFDPHHRHQTEHLFWQVLFSFMAERRNHFRLAGGRRGQPRTAEPPPQDSAGTSRGLKDSGGYGELPAPWGTAGSPCSVRVAFGAGILYTVRNISPGESRLSTEGFRAFSDRLPAHTVLNRPKRGVLIR